MRERRPPRASEWLAARLLPESEREMILGDLHEEFLARGTVWYCLHAPAVAIHRRLAAVRGAVAGTDISAGRSDLPTSDGALPRLVRDIRFAGRALARRPMMAATVALTLALGLGANAAIFNMIDRLVFHPYAVGDPDRVVLLAGTGPGIEYRQESVSIPDFYDWRDAARSLDPVAAFSWWDANLTDTGNPERVAGFQVTSGFFATLGMRPALGRDFIRDDETFGRHHVVVLSDALWKRRFQADPAIVGRRILVDGEPSTVIGVMPPRVSFPKGAEIWSPFYRNPAAPEGRGHRVATVIGHLAAGRTLEDAQAEMTILSARLAKQYPDVDRDHGVRVYTLNQGMLDQGLGPILVLWQLSAVIVLLIACANVANLLLARAAERRREMAVRLALGATRGRVVRECLVESLVLAIGSVPPAIAFAWLSLRTMRGAMPAAVIRYVPGFESIGVDARLVGFTLALAVLTACVFGLLPALQSARPAVAETLKEGGRGSSGRQWLRRGLVIAQTAIALPLLVAALLGVLAARTYLDGPQGYDPTHLLTMRLQLPTRTYPDEPAIRRFVADSLTAIEGVAGVRSAAAANLLPAANGNTTRIVEVAGHPVPDARDLPEVDYRQVTDEYFGTMGIPIVRGRAFTTADRDDSAPVAIISESMARQLWPGEDPVGRRVRLRGGSWMTVVGVSGDIIHDWFASRFAPTLFRPLPQSPTRTIEFAVRTAGAPEAATTGVRNALLGVDAAQPIFNVMTMREALRDRTIGLQFIAGIMSVFAGIALGLATLGLYAIVACMVAQRRREIGVRIALGASRGNVLRFTIVEALKLAVAGGGMGFLLALAVSRGLESLLLGIATVNPTIVSAIFVVLVAAAAVAAYMPARRAASIDPIAALRAE